MVDINNKTKQRISIKKTKKLVEDFFVFYNKNNWDVSVAVIGDRAMRRLNKDFRGIDKTTDVLSFQGGEFMGNYIGEVIININELKRKNNYKDIFSRAPSFEYLFNFILVHGLLHLIGYDDIKEKDRQKMLQLGRSFLDKFYQK